MPVSRPTVEIHSVGNPARRHVKAEFCQPVAADTAYRRQERLPPPKSRPDVPATFGELAGDALVLWVARGHPLSATASLDRGPSTCPIGFVIHMGCSHCHIEYMNTSKRSSCATIKNNKVNGNGQRKDEKTVVVDKKTCKSYVCVGENEWKVTKATTERYPETENPSGGTCKPYRWGEVVYNLS
jgi:hypothetical protein